MNPKLSVILPTRERCDTLKHTLRTLVEQDCADCEFIVSDNASQDATKAVVETFADPRIVYVNTGQRLDMNGNFEFALSHAKGTYVTSIGDDDGFLPNALTKGLSILEQSRSEALVWQKCEYGWPDHIDPGFRNWLSIDIRPPTMRIVEGLRERNRIMDFRTPYAYLPCIYNGIVQRSAIEKVRKATTNGMFFNSISPDIYSGLVLASVIGSYLRTDYPFSVNGASRHSNGTSFMTHKAGEKSATPHQKFLAENQRVFDDRILFVPSVIVCIMGEYLLAQKHAPGLNLPEAPWKLYIDRLAASAAKSPFPEEIMKSAAHTAAKTGLPFKPRAFTASAQAATSSAPTGVHNGKFGFTAPTSLVHNIYDACQLAAGMIPPCPAVSTRSVVSSSIHNVREALLTEAKALYRTF